MNTLVDHYAVLGVAENASPETIKAAFKKLALQYHPDVYKGTDAHARMRQLLNAYQTLSDADARREYDAQRARPQTSNGFSTFASSATSRSARSRKEVSPNARRDRNRHYAFPEFVPGRVLRVDLSRFVYTLTPDEARMLVREGMLRGVAAKQDGMYSCHRCSHRWREGSMEQQKLPRYCPQCYADDWSEFLLLRCLHCQAIFESEQIRYEVGTVSYGKQSSTPIDGLCPPYELFPLCPYCGKAHWSTAEEERVAALRRQAAQRELLMRVVWVSVALLVIVSLSWMMFGMR